MSSAPRDTLNLGYHLGDDEKAVQEMFSISQNRVRKLDGAKKLQSKIPMQFFVLDVGGGFPAEYLGQDVPPLEDYMDAIRAGMKDIALCPTVEVFAEPGRALVAGGCSLLTQVQLRKGEQLYINDGVYGSLSEMVSADIRLPARLIRLDSVVANECHAFILNGPTCDSLDVLPGTFDLPADAREGDWIEIDQVGAYASANATRFNGFFPETFVEVHDSPIGCQK